LVDSAMEALGMHWPRSQKVKGQGYTVNKRNRHSRMAASEVCCCCRRGGDCTSIWLLGFLWLLL